MAVATPTTVKVVCPLCSDPIQVRLVPAGEQRDENNRWTITLKIEETGDFSDHLRKHVEENAASTAIAETQDTKEVADERDQ